MEIKAYKILGRADIKLDKEVVMIIFESYLNKELLKNEDYIESVSFIKLDGEIILKVIKNQTKDNEEFINWKDYMKYRLVSIEKSQIKKYENINLIGQYIPYNDSFKELLKNNNINLKEGEELKLRVFGYDIIIPLNDKELYYHQFVSNNFQ